MSSSFLSNVEAFYDLAVKSLALPEGIGEKIKVPNATSRCSIWQSTASCAAVTW